MEGFTRSAPPCIRQIGITVPDITPRDITGTSVPEPGPHSTATEDSDYVIPATQPAAENLGTLSLRYVDGVAVLVVSGGNTIPGELAVVDANGTAIATYTPGAPSAPTAATAKSLDVALDISVPNYKIDDVIQAGA
ncbi:hypothetical protein [Streptomyces sp. TLI_171]|uniref:hypothetical protein n=1 Tax=Streptomyces sp. TLI_171 TaxID=1938859 RepID=UPI001180081D|nr:hypothetical protein [Streptomyces sp. TLI_171]